MPTATWWPIPSTDKSKWKSPATLVFTYAPVEDPAVYQKIFTNPLDHLSQCTGKKVAYNQVQSYAAQVEALRAGRLHIGGDSPGTTPFAVNLAGAVPFVVWGNAEGPSAYHMAVIVKKDSPYHSLTHLKGSRVDQGRELGCGRLFIPKPDCELATPEYTAIRADA